MGRAVAARGVRVQDEAAARRWTGEQETKGRRMGKLFSKKKLADGASGEIKTQTSDESVRRFATSDIRRLAFI